MTTKRTVCFVMPGISNSAEDPWQIIGRCDRLTSHLQSMGHSENNTVILVSHGFSDESTKCQNLISDLKVYLLGSKKVNSIVFLVRTYNLLKVHKGEKITLISGDNYLALLMCILLEKLIGPNAKIQISIHGNPLAKGGSLIKMFARKLAFVFLVPKASSVRLVSGHLGKELERYIAHEAEVFVSPISINMPEGCEKNAGDLGIGYIGRLHYERGVELFCRILHSFARSNQHFRFSVVGDGPALSLLENFRSLYPNFHLALRGSLPHADVLRSFRSMKVLVSCASSEGYGLVVREAVTSGTFVVALSNEGTRELRKTFPNMVFLFETVEEAVQLITMLFEQSPDLEIVKQYREKQLALDKKGSDLLIKSWL